MTRQAVSTSVVIRRANQQDVEACARICFEAFFRVNQQHGFAPEIPTQAVATQIISRCFSHPQFYCVVAEVEGKILGSNCLDERSSAVFGIGPITVDPSTQEQNIGRSLMESVLQRSHDKRAASVRLVQAAFNNRSLSLYTKLGFDVREPLALMNGPAIKASVPGLTIRPATEADIPECNSLCRRIYGSDRDGELHDIVRTSAAVVVEGESGIVGYASILGFMGHAVAVSNRELKAMIAAAKEFAGPGILVPTRNSELFRWCLANGLRVLEPLNLMSLGIYSQPNGAFLPSITY